MPARFSTVAVPLGNPEDLSPRARAALTGAQRIFCEDTRKLRELLDRAAVTVSARVTALPGDRENEVDPTAWAREDGAEARWVFVSDAGTPIVNDPGRALLLWCRERRCEIEAIPGPSAPVMAWQWSGGFGLPFVFAGFAPKAKTPGTKDLTRFFASSAAAKTFVFFDTKHQFDTTLAHLEQAGEGERPIFCAREMTKPHEELLGGTVSDVRAQLNQRLADTGALGELTFVLEGAGREDAAATAMSLEDVIALRTSRPKDAARRIADATGRSVKECYDALVKAAEDKT